MKIGHIALRRGLAGAVFAAALAGAVGAHAQSAGGGPFAAFVGNWAGGGQVAGSNGTHERLRCRATYTASNGGAGLSQSMVCASPSYRVDVRSNIEASGHNVTGSWSEQTRGATGQLTGTISAGQFQGSVSGFGFTAALSLRSNGRRQTVKIAPSAGDISDVSIELKRGG